MEVVYARCAGLDVHKEKILAIVRIMDQRGSAERKAMRSGCGHRKVHRDWQDFGEAHR